MGARGCAFVFGVLRVNVPTLRTRATRTDVKGVPKSAGATRRLHSQPIASAPAVRKRGETWRRRAGNRLACQVERV